MKPECTQDFFRYHYYKTNDQLKAAFAKKIDALTTKIAERQGRIAELRELHGIDDQALIQLLNATRLADKNRESPSTFAYVSNAPVSRGSGNTLQERTIAAGVVNNLLTESDYVESDKSTVERLKLILRNLTPVTIRNSDGSSYESVAHQVSEKELVYLGF